MLDQVFYLHLVEVSCMASLSMEKGHLVELWSDVVFYPA
jgi:hypothetical protein